MKNAQILSSKHYPFRAFTQHLEAKTQGRNIFVLGLGSNMGYGVKSSIDILESAFMWLDSVSYIKILRTSPIWRNPAFGFRAQNDFYNAVMICQSHKNIRHIYALIFYIERRFARGRKRAFKNAPRTLDIDIIFFNTLRLKYPHLHIPHRFYHQRASVMLPLSFIESNL